MSCTAGTNTTPCPKGMWSSVTHQDSRSYVGNQDLVLSIVMTMAEDDDGFVLFDTQLPVFRRPEPFSTDLARVLFINTQHTISDVAFQTLRIVSIERAEPVCLCSLNARSQRRPLQKSASLWTSVFCCCARQKVHGRQHQIAVRRRVGCRARWHRRRAFTGANVHSAISSTLRGVLCVVQQVP